MTKTTRKKSSALKKIDWQKVFQKCLQDGFREGWEKSHTQTLSPSPRTLEREITNGINREFEEVFGPSEDSSEWATQDRKCHPRLVVSIAWAIEWLVERSVRRALENARAISNSPEKQLIFSEIDGEFWCWAEGMFKDMDPPDEEGTSLSM